MKRKSLRSRFLGYISIALAFTAFMAIYSFFVIKNTTGQLGDEGSQILQGYIIFQIIFWVAFFVDAIFVERNMRKMEAPIKMVSEQALRMAQGQSIIRSIHKENNELGDLTYSINALLEYILERVEILEQINEGDYSFDIEPLGEYDKLTKAIINVVNTNNEVLHEIKKASNEINDVAVLIASGAETLSSGNTEQAATIEQLSAVMSEVKSMAEQTAEVSKITREGALESKAAVEKNNSDIQRMIEAMDNITKASLRIESVIKVIDEIAFQTNILALNAAIEAARAGTHGRGFAIVADEVRELASKSAAAARETSDLIQMSIHSVNEGNSIVRQTVENISSIEENSSMAVSNMALMADSSEKQRLSISDINQGINQLLSIIQANSIMSQENAMSSQKMAMQSTALHQLVGRFKLRDQDSDQNYQ